MYRNLSIIFFVMTTLFPFYVLGQLYCGPLENSYGPFDYTDPEDFKKKLPVVDSYHFTNQVESLIKGNTGSLEGDLDYTLRAFPNHHRALNAVSKYERQKIQEYKAIDKPYRPKILDGRSWPFTAECYFERALRWRPKDQVVHLLYAIHFHLKGDLDAALKEYQTAIKISPNYAEAHYNIGLLFFDKKEYILAKKHAKQAYSLGYPLQGLRQKLAGVNQWP